jgi:hypothetical protein
MGADDRAPGRLFDSEQGQRLVALDQRANGDLNFAWSS